jgi:hypothetical protein
VWCPVRTRLCDADGEMLKLFSEASHSYLLPRLAESTQLGGCNAISLCKRIAAVIIFLEGYMRVRVKSRSHNPMATPTRPTTQDTVYVVPQMIRYLYFNANINVILHGLVEYPTSPD